jgi:SAM-dependent methyltransferase
LSRDAADTRISLASVHRSFAGVSCTSAPRQKQPCSARTVAQLPEYAHHGAVYEKKGLGMAEAIGNDSWNAGDPYDRFIGRWSRRVAPLFLSWLAIPTGRRWLDVGCGTGALCAEILRHSPPAALTGVDPSAGFLSVARQRLPTSIRLLVGDAGSIPLQDGEVDVVASGLVLNFIAHLPQGLAEMVRVTVPGGIVAGYVWDYAEGMEMLRRFWDVASTLDPDAVELHEGRRFTLCRPPSLASAFKQASLTNVEIAPLEIEMEFSGLDDLWQPFLGAQGPAPAYVASLPQDRRLRLREALRRSLLGADNGPLTLRARAWAVRGNSP